MQDDTPLLTVKRKDGTIDKYYEWLLIDGLRLEAGDAVIQCAIPS